MINHKVSIFASAIRTKMWESCLDSFLSTSVTFEVVFGGHCTEEEVKPFLIKYPFFRYIHTSRIKPSQVYEITRRACIGETCVWFCDDGEANNDVIGKAYNYWKSQNNEKLILSIQTAESGYLQKECRLYPMHQHRFYGGEAGGPLMAPLAMMSRKFLDDIGGLDNRFICGQYENQIVMRAYENGGYVEIFGDKDFYIEIDHLKKSMDIGESKLEEDFINRPFAKGYTNDRIILESSWTTFDNAYAFKLLNSGANPKSYSTLRKISDKQLDIHHPYNKEISLTKSEGNNLPEIWE